MVETQLQLDLRVVVQFGKISLFVRDDRFAILFVISSGCEKSFPNSVIVVLSNCITTDLRETIRMLAAILVRRDPG